MTYIFCNFDWDRGGDIQETLEYSRHFTDVVQSREKYSSNGIAFISFGSGKIDYIMSYKKSGRVATKIDRITFSRPFLVTADIPLSSISEFLPSKIRIHFDNQTSTGKHVISPKVLSSIKDYFASEHPYIAEHIERLEDELTSKTHRGEGSEIIAHEKDAVALALRVGGFSDDDLPNWYKQSKPAPFVSGYQNVVLREDPMVWHDTQVFGDWQKYRQYVVGSVEFRKKGHKLTIMNVNRHRVEETLGVDLILYHHTFQSYILIQYKRMTKQGKTLGYRPIDTSYKAEVKRMDELQKSFSRGNNVEISDYRLSSDVFYFKLCPAKMSDPYSTKMIKGMYFPLSYWKVLLASKETEGKMGGRIVSYENTHRYINNTLFIQLVQNGWVGSRINVSNTLTEIIKESIDGERSLIMAKYEKESPKKTPNPT